MRPERKASDDGSVLIMALVFLSLFAVLIAASLTFAETGFKTAQVVHGTTESQYTADAAMDGAINTIRGNVAVGTAAAGTTNCFTLTAAHVNATPVTVDCTGRAGSGASTVPAGGGSLPANSILTLPANAAEGVTLASGAAPLVTGNVLTDEVLSVPATASLTVQGSLTCKTRSVSGTVTATTQACPSAAVTSDPNYTAEIDTRPVPAVLPAACANATVGTVTFAPGWYTSAAALNAFTTGGCTNKTFHFQPGAYYFEFADTGAGSTRQWLVSDGTATLVGGTLASPAAAFPNRCDLGSAGVQFIFGSDSRLAMTAGLLELCPPSSTGQRIALYGAKTTAGVPTPVTAAINPTTATSVSQGAGQNPYSPVSAALTIDGSESTFTASVNKGTGVLNLAGYTGVPANALISKAVLRVASRYDNTFLDTPPAETPAVTVTPGDGSAAVRWPFTPCLSTACTRTTPPSASPYEVLIDVTTQVTTPARANGLSLAYRIRDRQGIPYLISYVDGVRLEVTYTIPGLRGTDTDLTGAAAPTNCTITVAYPAAGCAVFRGSGSAQLAIKGTIYAPLAAIDLSTTGQTNAATQRGVIARTLQVGLTRGGTYAGPLIAMPGSANRTVLLTANIAGAPRLRAEVTIDDLLGAGPGTSVTLNSWIVIR